MASFYNNYYRFYRPYKFAYPSSHPLEEKDFPKEENTKKETPVLEKEKEDRSFSYSSFGPIRFKTPLFSNIEEPIFEIMGISLFLDDIIILGLLFFLYQEGVHDEMLYIALILLLIG